MTKNSGQVKKLSKWMMFGAWICCILSIGLAYGIGIAIRNDLDSFRPCSYNNGLAVLNCGKQTFNSGDFIIFGLFVLSVALVVCLFVASWRMTRRKTA